MREVIALQNIIITLLILLLIIVASLYLLQKLRFFELCKNYCSIIGAEPDTGSFGLDCKCIKTHLIFPLNLSTLLGAKYSSNAWER